MHYSLKIKKRIQHIQNMLHNKNLHICIWGYGLTGKSFLKWAKKNLSPNNTYYILDKNNFTFKTITEDNIIINFIPEAEKEACLRRCHFILPSPGIILNKNTFWYNKIIPELDIFYYYWTKKKLQSIIITGSIGKTSISTMINHYIKHIENTILCGNIGYPMLDFLLQDIYETTPVAIIECSSVQLEHSLLCAPTHFIITNLFPNHINAHLSYKKYIQAKLSPVLYYQKNTLSNIIIDESAYAQLKIHFSTILKKNKKKITIIKTKESITTIKRQIILHNDQVYDNQQSILTTVPCLSFASNWLITSAILKYFTKDIKKIINEAGYPTLPDFRLQKIIDTQNLIVYNDSKSTIIESSLAALSQIKIRHPKSTLIFLLGGQSKGVNRISGIKNIIDATHHVFLFGEEATSIANNIHHPKEYTHQHLFNAIQKTYHLAKEINNHCVIIFSPGGASFDEYTSYIDRGNKFNEMIKEIT